MSRHFVMRPVMGEDGGGGGGGRYKVNGEGEETIEGNERENSWCVNIQFTDQYMVYMNRHLLMILVMGKMGGSRGGEKKKSDTKLKAVVRERRRQMEMKGKYSPTNKWW